MNVSSWNLENPVPSSTYSLRVSIKCRIGDVTSTRIKGSPVVTPVETPDNTYVPTSVALWNESL